MKPHLFSFTCVVAFFFSIAHACAQLDNRQIDEALGRLPNNDLLKKDEKQQLLRVLEKQEKDGEYSADPTTLERYRFWLGDPKTFQEIIKRFREEAVSPNDAMEAYMDYITLSKSNDIETVTALADLLWREVGGTRGSGTDVILPSAAYLSGKIILDVLSRSQEVSPEVAIWAKDLSGNGAIAYAPIMREWWKRNERTFRDQRYKDVVPGPPLASLLPDSVNDKPPVIELPAPLPEAATPDFPKPASTVPLAESQPSFAAWVAGAVTLVIATLFFFVLRRRVKTRK